MKLAVILLGRNPQSAVFVRQKQKACEKIGIDFKLLKFSERIQEVKLLEKIKAISKDDSITGIIVQLPLPKHINEDRVLKSVPKKKNAEIVSPVVCAVEHILKNYKISLRNKNIVLIGKGRLVGRPVAAWLRKQNIKFFNIDKITNRIKKADIIISGAGRPGLIKGETIKSGAVIIDVGGDVDFESVSQKAGYITPIPGGVGPVVVACLLQNLVKTKLKLGLA